MIEREGEAEHRDAIEDERAEEEAHVFERLVIADIVHCVADGIKHGPAKVR